VSCSKCGERLDGELCPRCDREEWLAWRDACDAVAAALDWHPRRDECGAEDFMEVSD
jgi:hypothetical protein